MGTETEDSFRATGHHGESIGFLAADGFVAGCPIGAFLLGTDAGCQGIVGNEHLLTDQGKGHGVGGSSDVGNGVIGVSSSSTSRAAVKTPSGVLGIHTGNRKISSWIRKACIKNEYYGYDDEIRTAMLMDKHVIVVDKDEKVRLELEKR